MLSNLSLSILIDFTLENILLMSFFIILTIINPVDFVLKCFKIMIGGELFVPKIPSVKIVDLANIIAPNLPQKIIGVRPGEKIHEEMITETDSLNTYEFKDYYVILSDYGYSLEKNQSLQKYIISKGGKKCKRGFNYNSKHNVRFLKKSEIEKLIKKFK